MRGSGPMRRIIRKKAPSCNPHRRQRYCLLHDALGLLCRVSLSIFQWRSFGVIDNHVSSASFFGSSLSPSAAQEPQTSIRPES